MSQWLPLLVCCLLIAANALFVAAEFSLVTVDRATVNARAEAGDRRAGVVRRALHTLSTQLSGAQLGITVTSLIVGFLAEPAIASLIDDPLARVGVPEAVVDPLSVAIALAVATAVQMVLGELVPKNLAIARPMPVARSVAGPQVGFTAVAGPLIRFLNGNANWMVRRLGIEPQEELASARSPEELGSLVRRSAEAGTLPGETADLIREALDFGGLTAADVMTPRRRVRFLSATDTVAQLVDLVRATGHSRFPITGSGGADDVSQVAHLRLALRVPAELRATTPVTQAALPAILVPSTLAADDLLIRLRAGRGQIAVVVDEYGGTAGVASVEDLVEELVGEVRDEHDPAALRVRHLGGGDLLVSGLLRADELADMGIDIPQDEGYDTLGGYINDRLGRLARVGDTVTAPTWRLTVVRMDGRRIDAVRASADLPEHDDAPTEDAPGGDAPNDAPNDAPKDGGGSRR